ncbi:hypothetical protein KC341_g19229 [Hortaea werneckii]|nr:hypothetical protein KC341_g19229 [Hortaea werneckii]
MPGRPIIPIHRFTGPRPEPPRLPQSLANLPPTQHELAPATKRIPRLPPRQPPANDPHLPDPPPHPHHNFLHPPFFLLPPPPCNPFESLSAFFFIAPTSL